MLCGARVALEAARIKHLLVEYHPNMFTNEAYAESVQWMRRLGYRSQRIVAGAGLRKAIQSAIEARDVDAVVSKILQPTDSCIKPSKTTHLFWTRP